MAMNAHKAFNGANDFAFLKQLKLSEDEEAQLRASRDEIRATLKEGLGSWQKLIEREEFLDFALGEAELPTLQPKFRMQGSFSYHTVNDPAQKPPQEVDLDDGMFLPISFLSKNGNRHPAIISEGYFLAVEKVLAPLCQSRGWALITDKSSCVRIKISETAHIDIALYAISDDQFLSLVELSARQGNDAQIINESIEFADSTYRGIASDQIMLAHRDKGWLASDPRKLEDWFKEAVESYGVQVRFVSRYLKAWRDEEWTESRFASIALMAATVDILAEATKETDFSGRDDLALLTVANSLAVYIKKSIPNPVVEGQFLDQGWSDEERKEFVDGAEKLSNSLHDAIIISQSKEQTINLLSETFGRRLPKNKDLYDLENWIETQSSDLKTPAVLSEGLFKSISEDEGVKKAVKVDGDERYA